MTVSTRTPWLSLLKAESDLNPASQIGRQGVTVSTLVMP